MRKVLYLLSVLTDEDLEWMIDVGSVAAYTPDDVLIREGTDIDRLFIVLTGTLGVRIANLGDRVVGRMGPGEIVGELSFVDSRPTSASVEALERSRCLAVPRAALAGRLESDAPFAARFYRALALFLADRLRTAPNRFGFTAKDLDDDVRAPDELDPALMDTIHLAGARFDRMVEQLVGRE